MIFTWRTSILFPRRTVLPGQPNAAVSWPKVCQQRAAKSWNRGYTNSGMLKSMVRLKNGRYWIPNVPMIISISASTISSWKTWKTWLTLPQMNMPLMWTVVIGLLLSTIRWGSVSMRAPIKLLIWTLATGWCTNWLLLTANMTGITETPTGRMM